MIRRVRQPIPLSPPAEAAHSRARGFWSFALFTPILYLLLGWMFVRFEYIQLDPLRTRPNDGIASRGIILSVAVALLAGLIWLRYRRTIVVRLRVQEPTAALLGWLRHSFWLTALADSLGLLGLVYFFISGRPWALLAGGAAAYVAYLLAFPPRRDLQGIADSH